MKIFSTMKIEGPNVVVRTYAEKRNDMDDKVWIEGMEYKFAKRLLSTKQVSKEKAIEVLKNSGVMANANV